MKRSYAESLRSSSAMTDPKGPFSVDEQRLARAEALLREANRDRIKENDLAKARREAIMVNAAREEARKQGVEHSIYMTTFDEDETGQLVPKIVVFNKPSKQIVELMDHPQSLLTGLSWTGMKAAERIAMLTKLGMAIELAFVESVLEILPQKSKEYVLGWQKQINNGGAWNGSLSVGNKANELIHQGYLLCGKEPMDEPEIPARDSVMGLPGSTSYVKALMGETYLDWLLDNEEHPIEA